jgi:serine/threonine protein kinase
MGAVYRADHIHLKKRVAVKLLPPDRMADATAQARFQREMEVVGKLDHPNIVRATDAGEVDGTHFLVMELIEGMNLSQIVKWCGPLPLAEACELIRQAALGLQHAHEHGLVHRDIKPQNLMLTAKGKVKVLDLGLALLRNDRFLLGGLTGSGQVMGTADYMAPEQWEDSHWVDIRADMYSLGCTLYFLLTGWPPFGGPGNESIVRKMAAHLRDDPAALHPSVAAAGEILIRLLAKEPAHRPQTPDEVVRELTPLAAGANLLRICEMASQCANPDYEATSTQAQDVPPPSTTVGAQATINLRRPLGRRRWKRWAIAGIMVLVGTAALLANMPSRVYRDRQPSEETTSPPSAPDPEPLASRAPEANTWETLLKKKPVPRLWTQPGKSTLMFEANREILSFQTPGGTGLIPLGGTTKGDYTLQIGFQQTRWEGGIGVYIGGHTEEGKFRFQMVHLERPMSPRILARSHGTIEQATGEMDASLTGFAQESLKRPPGHQEYILEIAVTSLGSMRIRWNGDPYQVLTSPVYANRVKDSDFHGEFGIYCRDASATVMTARFLQSK